MLVRRQRVSAPTRPADTKTRAVESGAASPSAASGRGGGAQAAESGGAAGSGGLPPDPEATAQAPERRRGGQREAEAVQSRFAVEAVCCGALSCHERSALLEVRTAEGKRVLCPEHAPGWVRR